MKKTNANNRTPKELVEILKSELTSLIPSEDRFSCKPVIAVLENSEKRMIDHKLYKSERYALDLVRCWMDELMEINQSETMSKHQLLWYIDELKAFLINQ